MPLNCISIAIIEGYYFEGYFFQSLLLCKGFLKNVVCASQNHSFPLKHQSRALKEGISEIQQLLP
jgi:hypothetical protein